MNKSIGFVISAALISGLALLLPVSAWAATYSFSPASGNLTTTCEYSVNVLIDTQGLPSNSADLIVTYDPSRIQIIDAQPDTPGTQVQPGAAYNAYVYNSVTGNEIRLAAISLGSNLVGQRTFVNIRFRANSGVTSAGFAVQFAGSGVTTDSNIADANTNLDILTSVGGANFNFSNGSCFSDTTPPTVTFLGPTVGMPNFPVSNNIQFQVQDNVGVNLSSLNFTLNGVSYNSSSPSVQISGGPTQYTVSIDPSADLPSNQAISLIVSGTDTNGNTFVAANTFNVPAGGSGNPITDIVCDAVNPVAPIRIFQNTIIENTPISRIVETIVQTIGVPGSVAFLTGAGLIATLIPFLSILASPGILFSALATILGRRQRKPWGVVVDSTTGKPIVFATCRIFLAGTLNFVQQTITDTEGRYGFVLAAGNYRLEVEHPDYVKISIPIEISSEGESYVYDVKLQSKDLAEPTHLGIARVSKRMVKLWYRIFPFVFTIGFSLSFASIFLAPNWVNFAVFTIYSIALILLTFHAAFKHRTSYASVVDTSTGLRIPNVIVKIMDLKDMSVVDSIVTNSQGQFDFWGNPGMYALLVAARGYKFPSDKQTDLEMIRQNIGGLLKVRLKRGRNQLTILLDPVDNPGGKKPKPTDNLPSPFA